MRRSEGFWTDSNGYEMVKRPFSENGQIGGDSLFPVTSKITVGGYDDFFSVENDRS
jgi:hypothetical protein